jgi:hypothetical protein
MIVTVTNWNISTLFNIKDKINEQPPYQRGDVWKPRKRSILIDSILRGIDIPKIYLRKLNSHAYDYEVADGQQRLTTIFSFIENHISLLSDEEKGFDLGRIDGKIVAGLKYDDLDNELKNKFDNYNVTIAIIEHASNQEIRTLFGRLQEGEPLTPAERRNAIISKIGNLIDTFAINHNFFVKSRIPTNRFKKQDYLSHALALVFYNNKEPLKAELLLKMYLDKSLVINQSLHHKLAVILDKLAEIDSYSFINIYKKYHFIDMFYFLYKNYNRINQMNVKLIAKKFDDFEKLRITNYSRPEYLIENKRPTPQEKDLYDYIIAFKSNGAYPESIEKRLHVFNNIFL